MKSKTYFNGSMILVGLLLFFLAENVMAMPLIKDDTSKVATFSGKIIDKLTKKPVIFANVHVVGHSIGTVSNSDGEFVLKVPMGLAGGKLGITHLGYRNFQVDLSELTKEGYVIAMEPEPIPITEVIIRSNDPLTLLQAAMRRIEENYPVKPAMVTGFYREAIKKNRSYVELAEAILDVYKAPYNKVYDEDRVKIYKGRKSQDVERMDTVTFKLQGGPKTVFLLDVVKNPEILLEPDYMKFYKYSLSGMATVNDKDCYVIEFDQRPDVNEPLYSGKIYLDVNNLAITGLEFRLSDIGLHLASNVLVKKKPVSMQVETLSGNYLVNYKEFNNKWYLNYVRSELKFRCKWKKKLFNTTFTVMSEMAVTDIDTVNISRFAYRESARMSDVFADQVDYFKDEGFWGDYNYIKPDETIQEAIRRLNRRVIR
ncbi:MAG TPA: carboxypeptidase-like regulatory domain-containing protein [Bacteroidales bacterium]|nr:carboxypeptidase-like regulatory domain-containing protein [Bacteroidales bacterium]HQH40554.1 carboxypeptidase-like regulatory domain-containing protein [Bacteroidales bacterium]